jgi:hypothetical protein
MNMPEWFKPGLMGAGVGAAALAIVGFGAGGWVTESSANKMANDQASTQTVNALVPFCVSMAEADPNKATVMAAIKEARLYQRDDIVKEAGWATLAGAERPNDDVAVVCAEKLHSML